MPLWLVLRTPQPKGSTTSQSAAENDTPRALPVKHRPWPCANPRRRCRVFRSAQFLVGRGGHVATAACGWGRLVLLAHVATAATIGQVVLAFAVCNPIASLADLGVSGSLITDARRNTGWATISACVY